jgi:hypothetical protein
MVSVIAVSPTSEFTTTIVRRNRVVGRRSLTPAVERVEPAK